MKRACPFWISVAGWGFLLIEAARKYKIHGTGITLSHEQYAEFQKRIKDQGLEDYLTVELMDYRDLPKSGYQFDRVVSVGMLEHVGRTIISSSLTA